MGCSTRAVCSHFTERSDKVLQENKCVNSKYEANVESLTANIPEAHFNNYSITKRYFFGNKAINIIYSNFIVVLYGYVEEGTSLY